MNYLLIDTSNMFFRARHVAFRASDSWEKVGYALHISLSAINKVARKFQADHVVFALEGRSWRKDMYKPYKNNRAVARAALTEAEQEEDRMFWETYDNLTKYLAEKTNCSVIKCPTAEGDDIIARWIALHPQDDHVIISSDSDYVQLIAPNVKQYNGITDELITLEGYFNAKDQPITDKKTKQPKGLEDPQWLLFEKCMRGDTSDNVFSAYPGVREKGTKNKVGLRDAYADMNKRIAEENSRQNALLHTATANYEAVLKKQIEDTKAYIRLCHDCGGSGVKVRPNGLPPTVPVDKTLEQIGKAMQECAEYGEGFGVQILVVRRLPHQEQVGFVVFKVL